MKLQQASLRLESGSPSLASLGIQGLVREADSISTLLLRFHKAGRLLPELRAIAAQLEAAINDMTEDGSLYMNHRLRGDIETHGSRALV